MDIVEAVESPRILNGYAITRSLWPPPPPLPVVVVDTLGCAVYPSLCDDDRLCSAEMVSVDELDSRRWSCRLPSKLLVVVVVVVALPVDELFRVVHGEVPPL